MSTLTAPPDLPATADALRRIVAALPPSTPRDKATSDALVAAALALDAAGASLPAE